MKGLKKTAESKNTIKIPNTVFILAVMTFLLYLLSQGILYYFFINFFIALWFADIAHKKLKYNEKAECISLFTGFLLGLPIFLWILYKNRKADFETIEPYVKEFIKTQLPSEKYAEKPKTTLEKISGAFTGFLKAIGILILIGIMIIIFLTDFFVALPGTSSTLPTETQTSSLINYNFTSYENAEPYYSAYCDKINPYDLNVREAASDAIRNHPGSYNVNQLFDIYDWVKKNVIYQNVPLNGIPYSPSDTLTTKSGDCKNQAVLIASMVESIGGTSKVVLDPSCEHAYAIVRFGPSGSDVSWFTQAVASHYGSNAQVRYFISDNDIWVIFDPAGGSYPGNTLSECSGNRNVYFITSCLDCVNQYPNEPYTFGDKCYSQCPSGTIIANQHVCKSCPEGSYSCNNQCLSCSSGYIMGTDCLCHQPCGSPNTYCITGSCYNGRCV